MEKKKALREHSFSYNWEIFKFDICKFMRSYGSALAKLRKAKEEISEIAALTQRPSWKSFKWWNCFAIYKTSLIIYTNVKLKVLLCDLGGGRWSKVNKILHTSSGLACLNSVLMVLLMMTPKQSKIIAIIFIVVIYL